MTRSVSYMVDKTSVTEQGDSNGNFKDFYVYVDVDITLDDGSVDDRRVLVQVDNVEGQVRNLARSVFEQIDACAAVVADLPDERQSLVFW